MISTFPTHFHPAAAPTTTFVKLFTTIRSRGTQSKKSKRPPVFISTNPYHATQNLHRLSQLYRSCNHSCHRFPNLDTQGRVVEPIDLVKLRVAVSNSSVVVSIFARVLGEEDADGVGRGWWEKWLPVTPGNGKLVGFGRAVSDIGLTASIYDVMVVPSLQRMGIGRMIVQNIIRMLRNRGISDIAAVCLGDESLFFAACGFGDDILGSTTMMYSGTSKKHVEGRETIQAGRRRLFLP